MFSPRTILHPTDFSECSGYALSVAADLAKLNKASLLVLHVVESLGPENATFGEVAESLQPAGYDQRLLDDLRQVRPDVPPEIHVEHLLAEGEPSAAIERIAAERQCDLIVMGTHGHRGLSRLLLGSVAERVVRRANCSVLVVKPPGDRK